jgi:two-component system phosphate regulon sensor histidine kinase PhoR
MLHMKKNNSRFFIGISSIALLSVLLIQINWMREMAEMKENLFNEKAAIVLARTTEAVAGDSVLNRALESGMESKEDRLYIDSLFRQFMKYYNFNVDFSFDILHPASTTVQTAIGFGKTEADGQACYNQSMEEHATTHSWRLQLNTPHKDGFLANELLMPLALSIILVAIVLILFILTVRKLFMEQFISAQTTALMNTMTHEFKTPITNIALAGKLLMKETAGTPTDKVQHYANVILEENDRLNRQVEQVLSMSALERGELKPDLEVVDLHHLLLDTVKRFALQVESKQGVIRTALNAQSSLVYADAMQLSNAIGNLIDNAIKYSKGAPEIDIKTRNEDSSILLVLADKGIGIDKMYAKEVFYHYFRVPTGDIHNVKGFGLGLAYVRKVIELHNGEIILQSELGQGTTFTIRIPLHDHAQ